MRKNLKDREGSALLIVLLLLLIVSGYCALMASLIHSSSQSNLALKDNQQAYLIAKSGLEYVTNYFDKKMEDDDYGYEYVKLFGDADPCSGTITLDDPASTSLTPDELVGNFNISFDKTNMPDGYIKVISTGNYNGHSVQVFKMYNLSTFLPPTCRLTTGGEEDVNLKGGASGDVLLKGRSIYKFEANSGGTEFQNLVSKGGYEFGGGKTEIQGGVYGLSWILTSNTNSMNGKGFYSCKGIHSSSAFDMNGNLVVDARMYTNPLYNPEHPSENTGDGSNLWGEKLYDPTETYEYKPNPWAPATILHLGDININQLNYNNSEDTKKIIATTGDVHVKIVNQGETWVDVYALGNVWIDTDGPDCHINIYAMGNVELNSANLTMSEIWCAGNIILSNWSNFNNCTARAKGNIEVGTNNLSGASLYADGSVSSTLSWLTVTNAGASGIDDTALKKKIEDHIGVLKDDYSTTDPVSGITLADPYSLADNVMTIEEFIYETDQKCQIGDTTLPASLSGSQPVVTLSSVGWSPGPSGIPYTRNGITSPAVHVITINESCTLNGSINFNNYPYVLYFDASDGPIDVLINSKVSLEGQAEICVNDNGGKNRVRFFMYGKDADFKFASNNANLAGHVFRVQDDTLTPKNETVDDCGEPILSAVPAGWGSEVSFSDHELTTKDYNYGGANGGIPELYVFGVVNPDETPGPDDAPGGVFRVGGSGNVVTFRGYILSKYTDVICSYEGAPVFCGTVYCRNLQNLTANTSACIECHVPTSKKYTKAVQDIWS